MPVVARHFDGVEMIQACSMRELYPGRLVKRDNAGVASACSAKPDIESSHERQRRWHFADAGSTRCARYAVAEYRISSPYVI